jgi:hypothetical protein
MFFVLSMSRRILLRYYVAQIGVFVVIGGALVGTLSFSMVSIMIMFMSVAMLVFSSTCRESQWPIAT